MFSLDNWQEVFAAIYTNKLRTFATAFGVFWGILMLVILLGAGQGLQNGVERTMLLDAVNSIWISPARTSIPYQGMPAGRQHPLNEEDLAAISDNVSGIELMSPENRLEGEFDVRYSNRAINFPVFGADSEYFAIKVTQEVINGRSINPFDDRGRRKVALIGNKVAEALFPDGMDPVGEFIEIRDASFLVVGVFEFDGAGGMDQAQRIYIPFTTFQSIFNPGKQVESDVLGVVKRRHSVHPDDQRAFFVHNQEDQHRQVEQLFLGIEAFIWLVGLGTLTAGIVGVSNVMIIVVRERTREIGIRKALGAKPASIVAMVLHESILITAISGYIGLLLGVLLLEGINYALAAVGAEPDFFHRPEVDLRVAVTALVILILAGTIAGLIPALRAANIKAVEALRNE
jgi:putative ABC transport system permease protein